MNLIKIQLWQVLKATDVDVIAEFVLRLDIAAVLSPAMKLLKDMWLLDSMNDCD